MSNLPMTRDPRTIVLFTVNEHETAAVLDAFVGRNKVPEQQTLGGVTYNLLGMHGGMRIVHTVCEMGAGGIGASQERTRQAIEHWQPFATIAVGIAFGMDENKQKIGDVLVSTQLQDYDLVRVNNDGIITPRGDKARCSDILCNRLRMTDGKQKRIARNGWPKVRFGLMLSGQKLVDNLDFREKLKTLAGNEAIGGEMEGVGLYVAASSQKREWIVVKAICDWGHDKNQAYKERWQKKAAKNAARVLKTALEIGDFYPDSQNNEENAFQEVLTIGQIEETHKTVHRIESLLISQHIGTSLQPDSGAIPASLIAQLTSTQHALSQEIESSLKKDFEEILRGNLDGIEKKITEIRTSHFWTQLLPETRARVIRLQASLTLQRGDIDGAESFVDEADAIALPDEPRLRALIASRRYGAQKGIEIIGKPKSRDGAQLLIALLLDSGHIEDALELLQTHPALDEEHAETERLRALGAILQGRRDDAFNAIRRAEELAPDWQGIRRVGGMVRYACALSPYVATEWYLYPNPIDLVLVREDYNSCKLLNEAYFLFQQLVSKGQNEELRSIDETWSLACLCNLRDRRNDAEALCKSILNHNPNHAGAIAWGLARAFSFDQEHSRESLNKLLGNGQGEPNQVISLAWLLFADGQMLEAEEILERFSAKFETPQAQLVRDRCMAEFSERAKGDSSGKISESLSYASRIALLHELPSSTNNLTAIENLFEELICAQQPDAIALRAAQLLASADRWDFIAPHISHLLGFNTAEAVRIAAYAAFNSRQTNLALQILEQNQSEFFQNQLPHDLRTLRIEALSQTGDQAEALRQATLLSAESTTLTDKLIKADLHLRTGNVYAALPALREATKADLLSATYALKVAPIVAFEDKDLARTLVRHAKNQGIPHELSTYALDLTFRLGIEDEARSLFENVAQLASENNEIAGFYSLEQMSELLRHTHENVLNLQSLYFDGVIPVHFFAAQADINLGKLYQLKDQERVNSLQFSAVMIRHGCRPSKTKIDIPITEWRIHLDITGLLLAFQLNLLDVIEQLPYPIFISPSLISALYQLEIKSRHHQPARVVGLKAIMEAIEKNRIEVIELLDKDEIIITGLNKDQAKALSIARQTDCIVIDHNIPETTDSDILQHFTSIRAIIDGLSNSGVLDVQSLSEALDRIGEYGRDRKGIPPIHGKRLLFLTNTLTVLTSAGLLESVIRTYHVQTDSTLLKMAREEIKDADEGERLAVEIGSIRRRINEGIENGKYIYIHNERAGSEESEKETENNHFFASPIAKCLNDILRAPQVPNAVTWIEDRYLTGYQQIFPLGSPIVGIYEVLNAMRTANLISGDAQQDSLQRLRESGFMFLPIEPKEILKPLSEAYIKNGKVVETPPLAAIRRYLARILLLENHVKVNENLDELKGRPIEIQLLMDIRRLTETCIIAQWSKPGLAYDIRRARSSWIWSNLRIERFCQLPLVTQDIDKSRIMMAVQVSALLTGVFQIINENATDYAFERREAYMQWVKNEVLGERLKKDVSLLQEITRFCTSLFSNLVITRKNDRNNKDSLIIPPVFRTGH